ncbi:hypothetical protein AVEN_249013-1 [Araneus ventricosus]|uniref:Uncharacterized protein n=1 Tax=Araneus ventricosus TaxID=182803 RepID=A0A4Y2T1S9_ARAVE|nr:hypothetical protein AVEN_249013-1 [Araneus ventricosus]
MFSKGSKSFEVDYDFNKKVLLPMDPCSCPASCPYLLLIRLCAYEASVGEGKQKDCGAVRSDMGAADSTQSLNRGHETTIQKNLEGAEI